MSIKPTKLFGWHFILFFFIYLFFIYFFFFFISFNNLIYPDGYHYNIIKCWFKIFFSKISIIVCKYSFMSLYAILFYNFICSYLMQGQ